MVNQVSNTNYSRSVLTNNSEQRNNTSFNGNAGRTFVEKSKQAAKVITLSACLAAGMSCSNQSSGTASVQGDILSITDSNNITCLNVRPETEDVVVKTLTEYRRSLKGDKDFLEDVDVVIVDKFKNLDMNNAFYVQISNMYNSNLTRGISYYSDSALKKQIVIQENAHVKGGLLSKKHVDNNSLKHSLMHEVGHQFDSYFGHNHEAEFVTKWNKVVAEMAANPEKNPYAKPKELGDVLASAIYHKDNGLSDKKPFKDAMLIDLQNIAKIKKEEPSKLPSNLRYFINKINLSQEITKDVVDMADFSRSEVYANLFSYANNQDDGQREKFIKAFNNSYKVVQQDIEKYLK